MRYKLIGNNDYLVDPIATVLNNRGITDHELFLNLNDSVVHPYEMLTNIEKARDCLINHIKQGNKILLVVDCDCDGYTSSAVLYNYAKDINPDCDIVFVVHNGKEHGFTKEVMEVITDDISLVLMADAGSNQFDEQKKIIARGIDVVILDHHEVNYFGDYFNQESDYGIIVNNKMCEYPNKMLSGVGIVYKTCKAIDEKLGVNYADNYLDLVAVGNIGDMMDTRELETRYLISKGIKQIRNPFIRAIIEKQSFSMKGLINMVTIAFYVVPLINACVRFGNEEEKINMFHAFINSDITLPFTPKPKKGKALKGEQKEIQQPINEAMARICGNIKTKQETAKKKGVNLIEQRIQEKKLLDNKILIINGTGILEPTMTGLVANDLVSRYKRPVIILKHYKDNLYGGSARGYEKSDLKDFRTFLWDTDCFELVEGHNNAFGIQIKKTEIVKMNKIVNEKLKNMTFDNLYEVDFAIKANKLTSKVVIDIESLKYIWGQGVEEPLLAITDLQLTKDDIKLIGEKKNTIKFIYRNIEFVIFNTNEDYYNKLIENPIIKATVIGKCSLNEFAGNKTAQIMIKELDFEVNETDDELPSW